MPDTNPSLPQSLIPIISLAEVRKRTDSNRNGTILARIVALDNAERDVCYVSPYATNSKGAFIAIPSYGTQILVCQLPGSSTWYYLGSTFSPEPLEVDGDALEDSNIPPLERVDEDIYRARGEPMKTVLQSPEGAGLTISEEYNPDFFNKKTELHSTTNKVLSLNDSPSIDSVILDSGNCSRMILTSSPEDDKVPDRALLIDTAGPQRIINHESETDIVIGGGGRELQLLNQANGAEYGESLICGNVNIQSKWKDVNVFTQAKQGRIFIECLKKDGNNQLIQIETNGEDGAIVIKTGGDIRLDASGNIDMKAGGQIRMQSASSISIRSGGSLEVQSENTANIDAPTINLADGASPSSPNTQGQQSSYGNNGITKYP